MKRALVTLGLLLLGAGAFAPATYAADAEGLAHAAATKLLQEKSLRPQTHTTDFQGTSLGCITLTQRELHRFGYSGHAFFCENADTAEILGAVLNRRGVVRCRIDGAYVGDGCYDFTICGVADSACVVE